MSDNEVTPLVASRAASAIITAQEQEIERLHEKHKALHRRCQQAEAALVDYRKLKALPPDGDGVRFVRGSLGRALLSWLCDTQQRDIEVLREADERLRVFVAAFDEWQAAPQRENRDVLEQALWLYEKMLAARDAMRKP